MSPHVTTMVHMVPQLSMHPNSPITRAIAPTNLFAGVLSSLDGSMLPSRRDIDEEELGTLYEEMIGINNTSITIRMGTFKRGNGEEADSEGQPDLQTNRFNCASGLPRLPLVTKARRSKEAELHDNANLLLTTTMVATFGTVTCPFYGEECHADVRELVEDYQG